MPPKANKQTPATTGKVKPPLDLQRAQELNLQVLKRKDPEVDEVCVCQTQHPHLNTTSTHRSLGLQAMWYYMTSTSRPRDGYVTRWPCTQAPHTAPHQVSKNIEGSLFIVKRRGMPRFQMFLLNKKGNGTDCCTPIHFAIVPITTVCTDDFQQTIADGFTFQIEKPYLFYKSAATGEVAIPLMHNKRTYCFHWAIVFIRTMHTGHWSVVLRRVRSG